MKTLIAEIVAGIVGIAVGIVFISYHFTAGEPKHQPRTSIWVVQTPTTKWVADSRPVWRHAAGVSFTVSGKTVEVAGTFCVEEE